MKSWRHALQKGHQQNVGSFPRAFWDQFPKIPTNIVPIPTVPHPTVPQVLCFSDPFLPKMNPFYVLFLQDPVRCRNIIQEINSSEN